MLNKAIEHCAGDAIIGAETAKADSTIQATMRQMASQSARPVAAYATSLYDLRSNQLQWVDHNGAYVFGVSDLDVKEGDALRAHEREFR